jgi:hypothetical protein
MVPRKRKLRWRARRAEYGSRPRVQNTAVADASRLRPDGYRAPQREVRRVSVGQVLEPTNAATILDLSSPEQRARDNVSS